MFFGGINSRFVLQKLLFPVELIGTIASNKQFFRDNKKRVGWLIRSLVKNEAARFIIKDIRGSWNVNCR